MPAQDAAVLTSRARIPRKLLTAARGRDVLGLVEVPAASVTASKGAISLGARRRSVDRCATQSFLRDFGEQVDRDRPFGKRPVYPTLEVADLRLKVEHLLTRDDRRCAQLLCTLQQYRVPLAPSLSHPAMGIGGLGRKSGLGSRAAGAAARNPKGRSSQQIRIALFRGLVRPTQLQLCGSHHEAESVGAAPETCIQRDQAAIEQFGEGDVLGIVGAAPAEFLGEFPGFSA